MNITDLLQPAKPEKKARTREFKTIYAPEKPCAKCKEKPRTRKSYCNECHNSYSRVSTKKAYDRNKKEKSQGGFDEFSM